MRRTRRLPLEELRPYLLDIPKDPAPLDWSQIFGNAHPVELEVGFGKGMFLVTSSQANSNVNYVGIEIERKYQLYAATRIAKRSLRNVRLACGDARSIFKDHMTDNSIRTLHVYFPDPWWKTRHRKRRLFTAEFVHECARVLQPGGKLRIKTDVEDYFAVMKKLIADETSLMEVSQAAEDNPETATNFERKYRNENRPIYGAEYAKG